VDGSEYGRAETPHAIAAHTQVFSALHRLGFRERDVRDVLGELRKQNDLREASNERLLREALQRLAPPRVRPGRPTASTTGVG
jgi:Holliday junction resolvasome RuvABC DNA-binding subunit